MHKGAGRVRFVVFAAALFAVAAASGCGGARSRAVTVKGSDTMVILGQVTEVGYFPVH